MGFEDFLTAEDKIAALTEMRRAMFAELYTLCIRANIDPETVDYETWTMPEQQPENHNTFHFMGVIDRICESIRIIDGKIGKIENV